MATFSSVSRQNVLQAIAEYDSRGDTGFLDVYGFEPFPAAMRSSTTAVPTT